MHFNHPFVEFWSIYDHDYWNTLPQGNNQDICKQTMAELEQAQF